MTRQPAYGTVFRGALIYDGSGSPPYEGDPPPPMNLLGGREAYVFPSFASYADAIRGTVPAVNVAAHVGHSSLRLAVMTDISRRASDGEVDAMHRLAGEAMANGAAGFSTRRFTRPPPRASPW